MAGGLWVYSLSYIGGSDLGHQCAMNCLNVSAKAQLELFIATLFLSFCVGPRVDSVWIVFLFRHVVCSLLLGISYF